MIVMMRRMMMVMLIQMGNKVKVDTGICVGCFLIVVSLGSWEPRVLVGCQGGWPVEQSGGYQIMCPFFTCLKWVSLLIK